MATISEIALVMNPEIFKSLEKGPIVGKHYWVNGNIWTIKKDHDVAFEFTKMSDIPNWDVCEM